MCVYNILRVLTFYLNHFSQWNTFTIITSLTSFSIKMNTDTSWYTYCTCTDPINTIILLFRNQVLNTSYCISNRIDDDTKLVVNVINFVDIYFLFHIDSISFLFFTNTVHSNFMSKYLSRRVHTFFSCSESKVCFSFQTTPHN